MNEMFTEKREIQVAMKNKSNSFHRKTKLIFTGKHEGKQFCVSGNLRIERDNEIVSIFYSLHNTAAQTQCNCLSCFRDVEQNLWIERDKILSQLFHCSFGRKQSIKYSGHIDIDRTVNDTTFSSV
jgi:hypothetical protein